MRLLLSFALALLSPLAALAQNIGINSTGASPHISAMLDIDVSGISGNKRGLLIPRMTTSDRDAIPAPATSLLVFNITTNQFEYFDGTVWRALLGSASGWSTLGNAGTDPTLNFVGTTDARSLRFRTANQFAGNLPALTNQFVSYGLMAGSGNLGVGNTFIGNNAGLANVTGGSNTFVGNSAGSANVTSGNNTYVGMSAGAANVNGQQNVYIGRLAGGNGTTGSDNILIGNGAGIGNTASNNVMIGSFSGNGNSTGGGNTFVGTQSGQATSIGGQNTFIGTGAGSTNTTGLHNTLLGNGANVNANNLVNATAIGRGSRVDVNDGLVLGSVAGINGTTSTSLVGIGTTAPAERLHVVGSIRMVDGNQALNKVLVSDANGTASWQTLATSNTNAWGTTGNAGTNPATNFIGTTDFQSWRVRTSNLERMTVTASGLVGVRTMNPVAPLHVAAFGTLSGVGGFVDAVIRGESNGNAYAYLCTPNLGQSGILFGTPSQPFGAGIDFNLLGPGDLNFRTNNTFSMMIDGPTGNVGIGGTTPDQHLEVEGAADQYVRITSSSGASGIAGIELKRTGLGLSDWQVRNESGLLLFGQSADDLATVNDVLRLGGGSVTPAADASISCGQAALRWSAVFAVNGTINTSDAREKTNIRPLNYGLTEVLQLKPVRFQWKNGTEAGDKLGLVAQDLQEVLPEIVVSSTWRENDDGSRTRVLADRLGVYYSDIIPVLVNAIQQQQQQIEALRQEIEALKDR